MCSNKRKIVLVGTGMVGMSFAYSALNRGLCDILVLVDLDKKRALGEAMDLNHGLAFAGSSMKIYAGDYSDCADADMVVISAGVSQKPGESRLELLQRNTEVFGSIIGPVVRSGFGGVFLVATNPVDIMTRVTYELSGFNPNRVFGTGTTLDTARLRYLLGEYFCVDPRNMHAYVPWSQAMIATKPVTDVCGDSGGRYRMEEVERLSTQVRDAAQRIIEAKRATYYGIGMAMVRIARAVLSDENSVLTVSARLWGEYGRKGVYAGAPCIVNRNGVDRVLELGLSEQEQEKFDASCDILEENYGGLEL